MTIRTIFPFLFGRAFIEAQQAAERGGGTVQFPFLFGRAFIEAKGLGFGLRLASRRFPFLFGRAFIEAS